MVYYETVYVKYVTNPYCRQPDGCSEMCTAAMHRHGPRLLTYALKDNEIKSRHRMSR